MREIKFRAWDKKNNKMIPANEIYRLHQKDDGIYALTLGTDARFPGDFELMQSTGLKDKNGKEEVYEDDLIKDLLSVYKVVWNNKEAKFLLIDIKEPIHQFKASAIPKLTKIGNIHENPELLKEE